MPKKNMSEVVSKKNKIAANPLFAKYFASDEDAKRPILATIKKPLAEVSDLLNNIKNFPLFFEHLEKVDVGAGTKSTWHFKNTKSDEKSLSVAMHFETVEGEGVIWKSEDSVGLGYSVALQVSEAPAGRGTVVQMMTAYHSAVGDVAGALETLFGTGAELSSKKNLQRFKAFCETGHVPTTEGQSSGRDEDLENTVKH